MEQKKNPAAVIIIVIVAIAAVVSVFLVERAKKGGNDGGIALPPREYSQAEIEAALKGATAPKDESSLPAKTEDDAIKGLTAPSI